MLLSESLRNKMPPNTDRSASRLCGGTRWSITERTLYEPRRAEKDRVAAACAKTVDNGPNFHQVSVANLRQDTAKTPRNHVFF